MATGRTNIVLTLGFAAVLALGDVGRFERMMRAAHVANGLRCFSFGYSHNTTHEKIRRASGNRWPREQVCFRQKARNCKEKEYRPTSGKKQAKSNHPIDMTRIILNQRPYSSYIDDCACFDKTALNYGLNRLNDTVDAIIEQLYIATSCLKSSSFSTTSFKAWARLSASPKQCHDDRCDKETQLRALFHERAGAVPKWP
jgi:hypothetical protein